MATTSAAARSAKISFGSKTDSRGVHVAYPGKLSRDDLGRIEKVLIDEVIHGLTGCTCLSGVIPVIWEPQYDKVIQVNLATARD
ncbi:MAG TPA: hypothetical protein VGC56_17605 [Allosphingosinicella sp.]|jgi:hypothetical protein